jgi:hypothetical protein
MKVKTTTLKPKLRTFFGLLVLLVALMFTVRAILHVTTSMNAFDLGSPTGWLYSFGFPLFISLGVTFGARRLQLVIEDSLDAEKIKDWTITYFNNSGLTIKNGNENALEFESNHRFNRLFNHWFGTEIVKVRLTDNKMIIEGPFRHVDSVYSKLRFGKEFS